MRYIKRGLVALALGVTAGTSAAQAQNSSERVLPPSLMATNGIEADTSQNSVVLPNPTCPLPSSQLTAVRTGVGSAFIGVNAYLYHYFKKAWWSGERAPHFFFHADWDQEFRDQDKFGHMFGGYHLARMGYAGLRAACVSPTKAIIWSAAYAAAFQLQIEIFDGQFKKYGFSYADMIANTAGQALAVLQELHPALNAIKPTVSYHRTLALKNAVNGELRPSLDYSGQTYWFSTDVDRLLPNAAKPYWPGFIRVSAGHSITDWVDPSTGFAQRAKRKIVLSLDFDPEKLPGNAPWWRSIKRTLSYYHFPAPALELTPKLNFAPWYR
ncbi:MAG: YfiM family protein [Gemmatimonadota bacterium]|nr:YfiM family protein [Gemmatimonadota bacterium]